MEVEFIKGEVGTHIDVAQGYKGNLYRFFFKAKLCSWKDINPGSLVLVNPAPLPFCGTLSTKLVNQDASCCTVMGVGVGIGN